jgi:hypothetical protein
MVGANQQYQRNPLQRSFEPLAFAGSESDVRKPVDPLSHPEAGGVCASKDRWYHEWPFVLFTG